MKYDQTFDPGDKDLSKMKTEKNHLFLRTHILYSKILVDSKVIFQTSIIVILPKKLLSEKYFFRLLFGIHFYDF